MPDRHAATRDRDEDSAAEVSRHLPSSALLDALIPPTGFVLSRALCSAYSAQSTVIVAMLMAMTRYATPDGMGGSSPALVRALNGLRGKVHFLVQLGHWSSPRRHLPILQMLDDFVVQVPLDEEQLSWHPKVCLLRFVPIGGKGEPQWRLWIGSRNFTRDRSWDLALLLEGGRSAKGEIHDGVRMLASRLARQADSESVWEKDISELAEVRWSSSPGVNVDEISLDLLNDERRLPILLADTKRAVVVSPFLDAMALRTLKAELFRSGAIKPGVLTLVSTEMALAEMKPSLEALDGFQLLMLPLASQEESEQSDNDRQEEEVESDALGLHAKFIWIERPGRAQLLLGSTNLTARGWLKNTEARAGLSMKYPGAQGARDLSSGIEAFLNACICVNLDKLPSVDVETQRLEKDFARMRNSLTADLRLQQHLAADGSVLVTASQAPTLLLDTELVISRPGDAWISWTSDSIEVRLPAAKSLHENGDNLQIELRWSGHVSCWLHSAPFVPPLDKEVRNSELVQDMLGLEGMMALLNDMLGGGASGRGARQRWDEPSKVSGPPVRLPGIESVLAAWVRDQSALREIAQVITMIRGFRPRNRREEKAYAHVQDFLQSWDAIEKGLVRP